METPADNILPVPGFISVGLWIILIVILKTFALPKMYLLYSYMFVGSLVELILVYAAIFTTAQVIRDGTLESQAARLLQSQAGVVDQYHFAVVRVLAVSLCLNYIFNFTYVFIFCKYFKQYIPDRQIDYISNYTVLVVGTLTNFRFCLLAFCKMFPKPSIQLQNASKITPLHYMCIATLFT